MVDQKIRVLVFPCGTEIGLEINNSLKFVKNIDLFGASSSDDHGKMVYKNYIGGVPFIDDDTFLAKFNNILIENKIDFVFPAHDSVVLTLSKLQNKLNCEVITSIFKTCDICRSKLKSYKLLPEISPKVYNNTSEVNDYPVFLKPDVGQGSQGVYKVNNKQELMFHTNENESILILEYLPGKEYTVDCFTDKEGNLIFTGMRERIRIRNGISVNSKTRPIVDEQVVKMAQTINSKLKFRGMWFFQVKLDVNNVFKLLEIAPRVAGTMCLYRNEGINFELLSIYDRLGYKVDILDNKLLIEVDRALTNRFKIDLKYDTVYVDLDDTIIINNKINEYLIFFLYQCINNKIRIILVSKHIDDINKTLSKYKIPKDIFDEIIVIDKLEEKHKHISYKNSIFIDDSFQERIKINKTLKIPCFDLDMIESLIDWKR